MKTFVAHVSIHRWTDRHSPHPAGRTPPPSTDPPRRRDHRPAGFSVRVRTRRLSGTPSVGTTGLPSGSRSSTISSPKSNRCAEKGPPPPDAKTPKREVDARYAPELNDGVMINSAALWPPSRTPVEGPQEVVEGAGQRQGQEGLRLGSSGRALFPKPCRREVPGGSEPRCRPRLLLEVPPRGRLQMGAPPPGRNRPRLHNL